MKKIIFSILGLACLVGFTSSAQAVVDNRLCTVTDTNYSGVDRSFSHALNSYNRTSNRECTEIINHAAGTFEYKLTATVDVKSINDGESHPDGHPLRDGANLTIAKGQATSVTFDGSGMAARDCVINLQNTNVKFVDIIVKAKTREKAICGVYNPTSTVTIIADDDECVPNSTCCDARAKFAVAGTSCDNGSGTCGGDNVTCTPIPVPVCGNGSPEAGEQCDDGNTTANDGCSATCQTETPTAPVCGNSMTETGEQCDDGNTTASDGCSATCQNETPAPVCGNSMTETGEQCDDGNTTADDGCSATCQNETPAPVCGNGTTEAPEVCDGGPCCEASCAAYKAEGATCDDANASTSNDQCNAAHACVGTAAPGGGTVVPPGGDGGTTPPPGGGNPDGGETPIVPIGGTGGGSGGCSLTNSVISLTPLWLMILGIVPMAIRRKKSL